MPLISSIEEIFNYVYVRAFSPNVNVLLGSLIKEIKSPNVDVTPREYKNKPIKSHNRRLFHPSTNLHDELKTPHQVKRFTLTGFALALLGYTFDHPVGFSS